MTNNIGYKRFAYSFKSIKKDIEMHNLPLKARNLQRAVYAAIETEERINGKNGLINIAQLTIYGTSPKNPN